MLDWCTEEAGGGVPGQSEVVVLEGREEEAGRESHGQGELMILSCREEAAGGGVLDLWEVVAV